MAVRNIYNSLLSKRKKASNESVFKLSPKVNSSPNNPYVNNGGVYSYTPPPDIYVQVGDVKEFWEIREYLSVAEINKLKEVWPNFVTKKYAKSDKEFILFNISPEQAKYTVSKAVKTVQYCCFDATNEYLSNVLGKGLCKSDKDWFRDNPYVTSMGPGIHHVITVLNDLVWPYNIGVSRIYYPKNTSLSGDTKQWSKILGVNPKAEVDRDCSNDEYLNLISGGNEELKKSLKPMVDNWQFEFVDNLPPGSYVLFSGGKTGVGHTVYIGPRDKIQEFSLALQFDFKNNIYYHEEPITRESETQKPTYVLDIYKCTYQDADGTIKEVGSLIRKPGQLDFYDYSGKDYPFHL